MILLQIDKINENPTNAFKFCMMWLEEEKYMQLVERTWTSFDPRCGESTCFKFIITLQKVKKYLKEWVANKAQKHGSRLNFYWKRDCRNFQKNHYGIFGEKKEGKSLELEGGRQKILTWRKGKLRRKSHSIWIEKGDKILNYFIIMLAIERGIIQFGRWRIKKSWWSTSFMRL